MSHRIACYTLFDITKTGVLNRGRPGDDVVDKTEWFKQRNTQCNFDTILQIISLRAQPDVTKDPYSLTISFDSKCSFGEYYRNNKSYKVWSFDFEVQHSSVFEDGIIELGALYKDCDGVPMIKTEQSILPIDTNLNVSEIYKNIYFVKY